MNARMRKSFGHENIFLHFEKIFYFEARWQKHPEHVFLPDNLKLSNFGHFFGKVKLTVRLCAVNAENFDCRDNSFPSQSADWRQGDQIGRIFACWAIVFFGQFFRKKQK
jgi:hypothetical protein